MNQAETPQTSSSWRAPRDFVSVATGGKTGSEPSWGPAALGQRRERIRDHLANIAPRREGWVKRVAYYYGLLSRLLRFLVEPQRNVLSVRCSNCLEFKRSRQWVLGCD